MREGGVICPCPPVGDDVVTPGYGGVKWNLVALGEFSMGEEMMDYVGGQSGIK